MCVIHSRRPEIQREQRLVNDLISVSNRFKEDLRYRENRRLVNDLFPGVLKICRIPEIQREQEIS